MVVPQRGQASSAGARRRVALDTETAVDRVRSIRPVDAWIGNAVAVHIDERVGNVIDASIRCGTGVQRRVVAAVNLVAEGHRGRPLIDVGRCRTETRLGLRARHGGLRRHSEIVRDVEVAVRERRQTLER